MTARRGRPGPADSGIERRLPIGAFFLVLVWTVLLARLFFLQVVEGERFRISAERNSIRTHRVPATRGIVLDRDRKILVDSRPAFDVLVVPHEAGDIPTTLGRLSRLTGEGQEALVGRVGRPTGRGRFQPRVAIRDVERDVLARVQARLWALPGVLTQASPVRFYPFGTSGAHILGTIGEINASQLGNKRYAGYRLGDEVGKSGVEWLEEADLRGRPGGRNVLVDVHGRELELLGQMEPQAGRNVVLTISQRLQQAAEAALDESGKAGAVVALDPRNGEVLLLTSRPAFDPNRFAAGIDRETWEGLVNHPRSPLQNRALQGQYPPGSTYKVVTAIAGIEEGVIREGKEVVCGGSLRLGRRRYRCWKRGGHGRVDLHRAVTESCDVFFYTVGLELGVDRLAYYARALGLGRPTGIDLGSEAPGLVPTSAWKERRFNEPWVEGETLSIAIGQGFNLWTPLQLASVYAAIANGGRRYRPFVVKGIEEPGGESVRVVEPTLVEEVPISNRTLETIRRALHGVVHDLHGTGARLRGLPGGVEAAGKTGTAQVVTQSEDELEDGPDHLRDHAWFVGYAPAESPTIVVAVLVEHGGHGSQAAGPIARRVMEVYFTPEESEIARR